MIEVFDDKKKWIDFLHTLSKDELIEFIMKDTYDEFRTPRLLQVKFGARLDGADVDQLLEDYREGIEVFAYTKNPDVEYIETATWILIGEAEKKCAEDRERILTEVRDTMQTLWEDGVGYEVYHDDDWLMIKDYVEKMLEGKAAE